MFDAAAARDYGLVNWTVPPAALADEVAKLTGRLAKGPTVAYGEAKALLNASLGRTMEAQMEEELFAFGRCAVSSDLKEGVSAFVEKRRPAFRGA
jgi:2-(1,2-epoxy-1,2-dihydrophenyl)acetyl-CoA isomerase